MPLPAYAVERYCRRTRRTLATCAEGLTHASASRLASALRADDRAREADHGYRTVALPLVRQAELAEAAGLVAHAADPAPYRLAA